MAAYAALVSLLNIIDQIQNHPRLSISLDKKQIESLDVNICFLLDFIENRGVIIKEAQELESQIASAAYVAEDVIESHVVDQIHAGSISLLDLHSVLRQMDSVKEKVMEAKMIERSPKDTYRRPALTSSTPLDLSTGRSKMVGFDYEFIQLLDALTGGGSCLQIIPVVGMGGTGKTTLVRNAYGHTLMVHHFEIRAWATISQEFSVGDILLTLTSGVSKYIAETNGEMEAQVLGKHLHQCLIGRRYLIILDDVWSIEAWDMIKFFFPDNNNGSRIVVTTRLPSIATHFDSLYISVKFLDEDESWKLFCENAFQQEGCPPELEGIGKKIVKKCRGHPLSIVVVGGLLMSKSSMRQEFWEKVSEDIASFLNSVENENNLDALYTSYRHLPAHLKPCFLYMGVFPEDHEIRVSRLLKLWVAEGFIRPYRTHSLEEVAEINFKDLVDRNLILVNRLGSNGGIKTCTIFHLYRDLCLRVAEEENFFCAMKVSSIPRDRETERRVVVHEKIPEEKYECQVFSQALESASLARSLVCKRDCPSFKFRLLRVLNVVDADLYSSSHETIPDDIFKQVNLSYICTVLASRFGGKISRGLPSSMSLQWNLQMLIIEDRVTTVAPPEIWEMRQLRHLEFDEICLPVPNPPSSDQQDDFLLPNLQTLKRVLNLRLSEDFCKRTPNIKKLQMRYYDSSAHVHQYGLDNLHRLHKLESLSCCFYEPRNGGDVLNYLTFPSSLRKLTLERCCLNWDDLTKIGCLPNLEVLKLIQCSAKECEWNPVEGDFLCLKFLGIYFCNDLVRWNADSSHFPVLENLVLEGLSELDEIPFDIGDIPTLGGIRLIDCSESAAISAINILEEQQNLGNAALQVGVRFWEKGQLLRFKKKMKQLERVVENYRASRLVLIQ